MSSPFYIRPARTTERRSAGYYQAETPVSDLIWSNKWTCAGAVLTGLTLAAGAKYVAAALLIISMALGN